MNTPDISNVVFNLFLVDIKDVKKKYIQLALPYTESLIQSWHDYSSMKEEKELFKLNQAIKHLLGILKLQSRQKILSTNSID